jgi:type I restriction enzyme S subunit
MSDHQATDLTVDWGTTTLGQVTECILGGTPSTEVRQFWGGDVPWMASGDVHLRRITDVPGRITALGLRSSNATLTCPPAVAVGLAGQGKTRGTVALTLCTLSTNQSIALLKANGSELRTDYLFHNLDRRYEELRARSSGGGRGGLSKAILEAVPIELPPLHEQQKVAQILDTLDTAIHETEAIIAKLKTVKQGLLHDLLTRGIDANGELRSPQSEAPHLYKQSALGWIPKEWACKPFGELCESSAFGPRFPSGAYDENGPLATLRTTDMDDEGNISLSTMPRAAIKPSVFADHLLLLGDIVISRSGTCGVTGVFNGYNMPVVPGAFLIRFRLRDLRLNRFYRRYFNSSLGRPYLERLAVGGVQKNIKGSDVLCLQVVSPEPTEAVAICDRIESVEHDIENNQLLLRKLKLQKSGLMDDLLTGRVRVTPLLEGVTS